MFNYFSIIPYPKFKLAILALLALNAVIYAVVDTWTSAIDALIWLTLLVLYELEANGVKAVAENTLQTIRNVLIVIIALVFVSYVQSNEWLDVINSALWFALIALLELEVRWPDKAFEYRQAYWLATVAVFTGLIALVIAWAWQSAWLDVYDAVLWIVAFASIEIDIFQFLQRKRS
ncbi:MAG: hypothetical protein ACXWT3_03745 [Methylococcaceae bacterium]